MNKTFIKKKKKKKVRVDYLNGSKNGRGRLVVLPARAFYILLLYTLQVNTERGENPFSYIHSYMYIIYIYMYHVHSS